MSFGESFAGNGMCLLAFHSSNTVFSAMLQPVLKPVIRRHLVHPGMNLLVLLSNLRCPHMSAIPVIPPDDVREIQHFPSLG